MPWRVGEVKQAWGTLPLHDGICICIAVVAREAYHSGNFRIGILSGMLLFGPVIVALQIIRCEIDARRGTLFWESTFKLPVRQE